MNSIIVFIKVSIVLIFIAIGWQFVNPGNHAVLRPRGHRRPRRHLPPRLGRGPGGAGIVFSLSSAYRRAVSTAAQEAKNPEPICRSASSLAGGVYGALRPIRPRRYRRRQLAGVAVAGKEASVAYAIQKYMTGYGWLATLRDRGDPRRLLIGDLGHAARPEPRVLLDGQRRRFCLSLRRPTCATAHPVQVELAAAGVRRPSRRLFPEAWLAT